MIWPIFWGIRFKGTVFYFSSPNGEIILLALQEGRKCSNPVKIKKRKLKSRKKKTNGPKAA